ncbi:hypothetical protein [Stigmatella aurantiaca]|uniref:Conserved uncharacterized protein n=1 Tax=Stigmatella aurantiaca (strain DW4/3-1) TaxID=378806 RepID=E3FER6_STIAD|nr:hypothetical protein [Stigmatella aurantiaca]ADO68897.1 conserved uncharacterized protein [Stigmatella aurantiaca DW4/3-1]
MSQRAWAAFLLSSALLATAPLWRTSRAAEPQGAGFPGWPTTFEGQPLRELPLSEREQRFGAGFPGRIARFTDGRRELIFRWIQAPTRQLHSAEDCFRGLGYTLTPATLWRHPEGTSWHRFTALRDGSPLVVREAILDGASRRWTDVSAWYWSALLEDTEGPWWAITVAEGGIW